MLWRSCGLWAVGYSVPPTKLQGGTTKMLDGAWRWRHADRCTQPKLFRFAQSNVCRICTALWHANGSTTRKQQKRVAECKRQHAYLSPCASATLYLEEHHLHAQSRLRRPLGRTTANGRAELYPAFGVCSRRSFQSASILPIRMGVRSTLRAIRFRLSPGYTVTRLRDRVLLGEALAAAYLPLSELGHAMPQLPLTVRERTKR